MVFSEKLTAKPGKRIWICLFLVLVMLYTSNAETIQESTAAEATYATVSEALSAEETLPKSEATLSEPVPAENMLSQSEATVSEPIPMEEATLSEPVSAENTLPGSEATASEAVAADPDAVHEEGTQIHIGPLLMVTDYSVIEGDTFPGSSFVLRMSIANLSEDSTAYNALATLKIENVSVSLQEGFANQIYFHEIEPMQTVYADFPLEVYSYCAEENMILSMTMTCYDSAAVHYNFQSMMTPNVEVARTLYIVSLNVPQFVHKNSGMIISAALTNVEPVTLSNIEMHVVTQYGEQVTQIGQLISNESTTTNAIYRFPEQRTESVQVFFTYESLYGQKFSTDPKSFEVVVYDPEVTENFTSSGAFSLKELINSLTKNTVVPIVDKTLPIPVCAWIALGFAGYFIVLYCVLRRKRR